MKRSTLLALILTSISTAAFAQTPAPAAPTTPPAGMMPQRGAMMHGGMEKHMENVWDEMDTNKDGAISKEESAAFGAKKFDERDTNHDGKVTKEEWDGFLAKKMEEYKNKMGNEHGNMGGMPAGAMPTTQTAPAPAMTMEKK